MNRCTNFDNAESKVHLVDGDETVRFCEKCYHQWMSDQFFVA
ncbi:hypothetical protein [Halobacillus locisalis]|nr:hypothetical protein [Halobacillus locisalis]